MTLTPYGLGIEILYQLSEFVQPKMVLVLRCSSHKFHLISREELTPAQQMNAISDFLKAEAEAADGEAQA